MKPSIVFSASQTSLIVLTLATATPAVAQDRTAENAVAEAEDGFGSSVGRENIGIYNVNGTRGFSPRAAGNVRIDGLYFDPATELGDLLSEATAIKVGLSAQGYPFAAPSGIADTAFRRPSFSPGASLIASADSFGSASLEATGSLPLSSTLTLGFGASAALTEYSDGTSSREHSQALVLRWKPSPAVEILPFWTLSNTYDNEAGPFYVTLGDTLPPQPPRRRFDGPDWADGRWTGTNLGLLAMVRPGRGWTMQLGAFRSVSDQRNGFANLLLNVQPDGSAKRLIIADPRHINSSLSGELRLARDWTEGERRHELTLSLRERDARRQYGGDAEADLGAAKVGEAEDSMRPDFVFGPISQDRVRQETLGLSYSLRWRGLGELGLGISRANYRKTTTLPGQPAIANSASPWLWNANVAPYLSPTLSLYAGYARGLEESGLAPPNAANRSEPLPAIITEQKDAGLRWAINPSLKLVAGVFDLTRPYFGYATGGTFRQIGTVRNRGLEFSLSGALGEELSLVAGGVIYNARVKREMASEIEDERPFGIPSHLFNLNLDWRPRWAEGVSFDLAASFRGDMPAATRNESFLPSRALVNLGARYRFNLAERPATLRLQVTNLFDNRSFGLAGPNTYVAMNGRYVSGSIAMDF